MTTNRKAHSGQATGTLKIFLVVGSLLATLVGTRLLAAQDVSVTETAVPVTGAITVMVPAENSTTLPLPPTSRGTQIELKQIPQVVQLLYWGSGLMVLFLTNFRLMVSKGKTAS